MSGEEPIFFLFATACVGAAAALLFARDSRRAGLAFAACMVGLAFVELLLLAPLAALFALVVAAGVVAITAADGRASVVRRWRANWVVRAATFVAVGLLGFVFLGTWARQWMTAGAELDKRPEFGTMTAASEHLISQSLPLLVIAALLLPCAVIAAVVASARLHGEEQTRGD